MRGFQNGLIFKIWPSGSGDIQILVLQKTGFFRQDLGNLPIYLKWHQKEDF